MKKKSSLNVATVIEPNIQERTRLKKVTMNRFKRRYYYFKCNKYICQY